MTISYFKYDNWTIDEIINSYHHFAMFQHYYNHNLVPSHRIDYDNYFVNQTNSKS